eukprot:6180772-Pleurochrysis_carterae.AAC.2
MSVNGVARGGSVRKRQAACAWGSFIQAPAKTGGDSSPHWQRRVACTDSRHLLRIRAAGLHWARRKGPHGITAHSMQ